MSNSGRVVGSSTLAGDAETHAFMWTQAGGMVDLGALPGGDARAIAVNESGAVTGTSLVAGGDRHTFYWTQTGGMVDIGTLGGNQIQPTDINDSGQVVGYGRSATGGNQHAFSWTPGGGLVDLQALVANSTEWSIAWAVNNAGQVAGYVPTGVASRSRPFLWTAAGGMLNLGTLPGGIEAGEATDVNEGGQVTGWLAHPDGSGHGFVWTPATGLVDLGAPLDGDAHPTVIDDAGHVAGWSVVNNIENALLWEVDGLEAGGFADADGDGVADAIDAGAGAFTDAISGQPDTTGSVVSVDAGLTLQISDADDPDGVTVTVGPGTGRVTLSLCGGAFTARVYAGSTAVLTCGSLTEQVIAGQAEIVFGSTVVTIPAGATAKVADNGGGSWGIQNLGGGSITVTTNGVPSTLGANASTTVEPPPPADTTPPVVTPTVTGTLGNNGWYRSAVSVTWAVGDPDSAVGSQSGCAAASVTGDTAGVTFTCTATSAGGTTTKSVTVKRDATAPAAAYAAHPATYAVDQNVAFACTSSDALAGLATACQGVSVAAATFTPGLVTITGTATDLAGNARTVTTTFTVAVTATGLCNLTRSFTHGSAKYIAATKLQKAGADPIVAAGCVSLSSIKANTTAKQKAVLVAAYRATVGLLASPGWISGARRTQLSALAGAL